jgi:hypothetical protein
MEIKQATEENNIDFSQTAGEAVARVLATALILPMIIWAIVEEASWSYDATLDELAEDWAAKFEQGTKYSVIYKVHGQYTKMCMDMEVKNEFVVEETSQ